MVPPDDREPANPLEVARRHSRPALRKRFYKVAAAAPEAGGFALRLDGSLARTPGRNPLVIPHSAAARAMAEEWRAQRDVIDPASMPVTRLANSAIDGVAPRRDEVREATLAYAGSDLLCYRAGEPEGLVARQNEVWDPIVAWAERRFGVRFVLAEGVVHVRQPEPALAAVRAEIGRYDDPFRLAGLNLATTLSGSVLIALALAEGALAPDEAWSAAHVDEDWNIKLWGEDDDAMLRRARRFEDFRAAALALTPPTASS